MKNIIIFFLIALTFKSFGINWTNYPYESFPLDDETFLVGSVSLAGNRQINQSNYFFGLRSNLVSRYKFVTNGSSDVELNGRQVGSYSTNAGFSDMASKAADGTDIASGFVRLVVSYSTNFYQTDIIAASNSEVAIYNTNFFINTNFVFTDELGVVQTNTAYTNSWSSAFFALDSGQWVVATNSNFTGFTNADFTNSIFTVTNLPYLKVEGGFSAMVVYYPNTNIVVAQTNFFVPVYTTFTNTYGRFTLNSNFFGMLMNDGSYGYWSNGSFYASGSFYNRGFSSPTNVAPTSSLSAVRVSNNIIYFSTNLVVDATGASGVVITSTTDSNGIHLTISTPTAITNVVYTNSGTAVFGQTLRDNTNWLSLTVVGALSYLNSVTSNLFSGKLNAGQIDGVLALGNLPTNNINTNNASTLSSGTVPVAQLPATLQQWNGIGTNAPALNGSNITSIATANLNIGYGLANSGGSLVLDTNYVNTTSARELLATEATTTTLPAYAYNNANGTITGLSVGGLTIDGQTVAVGDTVLVKNETTAATNGIYTCSQVGSLVVYILTRASYFNSASNILAGDTVFVRTGTVNTNTAWELLNTGTITIGTTPLNFLQTGFNTALGNGAFGDTNVMHVLLATNAPDGNTASSLIGATNAAATKAQQATNGLPTGAFTVVGNAAVANTNTMKVAASTNADFAGVATNDSAGRNLSTVASTNSPPLFTPTIYEAAPTTLTQSGTNLVIDGSTAGYATSMKFMVTCTNNLFVSFTNWAVGAKIRLTVFQGAGLTNVISYQTNRSTTQTFVQAPYYNSLPTNTANERLILEFIKNTTTNMDLPGQFQSTQQN